MSARIDASLPIGGTTGLEHQSTAAIEEAAVWLAALPVPPSPVIPTVRSRFGLCPKEACMAIQDAQRRRARDAQ